MGAEGARPLKDRLAEALPEGCRFIIHHLSSKPTELPATGAIFAPLPGRKEEETYGESHFLSVSILHKGRSVQVFALEVLIYITARLTILFVSKADSTGYLYLLDLPQGTPSPLRTICTTFLRFLAEERERPDRKLLLSLFARSQNQYLFSRSVENKHKHVLTDIGLIKWWCKVVDPLLKDNGEEPFKIPATTSRTSQSLGFLRVPGCDNHEIEKLFPNGKYGGIGSKPRWMVGDPLRELAQSLTLPERYLIPRFPDDPKARYLNELDEELPTRERDEAIRNDAEEQSLGSGRWRSVKSLDEFWEMMSFRQECSAGNRTGFLWAVFTPKELPLAGVGSKTTDQKANSTGLATPLDSQSQETDGLRPEDTPLPAGLPKVLPITPQPLRLPSQVPPTLSLVKAQETQHSLDPPERIKHYFWPPTSRGEVILQPEDYAQVGKLQLELDYESEEVATNSTEKLINDVAQRAKIDSWGSLVQGQNKTRVAVSASVACTPAPAMLNPSFVRKKKKRSAEDVAHEPKPEPSGPWDDPVAVGEARKKAKTGNDIEATQKADT